MNEHRQNQNATKLSDDQMDGLLSSFFQHEAPAQLKQLPSEWASLQSEAVTPTAVRRKATSRFRRMNIAAASLSAACVLALVISNSFSPSPEIDDGAATVEKSNLAESILDQDATLNVSSSGSDELAVDDVNTTLEEIDMIDLSPLADDKTTPLEDRQ